MNKTLAAIEALVLAVLLLPLVLLARLISPPAPQPAPVVALEPAAGRVATCRAPAPSAGRQAPVLATLTTVALRRLAQQQGIRQAGGRRTSKARKADLLEVLG